MAVTLNERKSCEKQIQEKMEEIWEIYKAYNPRGQYLTMDIISYDRADHEDVHYYVNNEYWPTGGDMDKPINACVYKKM